MRAARPSANPSKNCGSGDSHHVSSCAVKEGSNLAQERNQICLSPAW